MRHFKLWPLSPLILSCPEALFTSVATDECLMLLSGRMPASGAGGHVRALRASHAGIVLHWLSEPRTTGSDPGRARLSRDHLSVFGQVEGPAACLFLTDLIEAVHAVWLALPAPRPRHPLAPLVAAWQRRPPALQDSTTTVTGNATNMTRRVQVVSTIRRAPWTLDAEVAGAVVDGEPLAALRPDPAGMFPVQPRRMAD